MPKTIFKYTIKKAATNCVEIYSQTTTETSIWCVCFKL